MGGRPSSRSAAKDDACAKLRDYYKNNEKSNQKSNEESTTYAATVSDMFSIRFSIKSARFCMSMKSRGSVTQLPAYKRLRHVV